MSKTYDPEREAREWLGVRRGLPVMPLALAAILGEAHEAGRRAMNDEAAAVVNTYDVGRIRALLSPAESETP